MNLVESWNAERIENLVSPTPKYDPVVKMNAKVLRIEHVPAGGKKKKFEVTGQYKEHTNC